MFEKYLEEENSYRENVVDLKIKNERVRVPNYQKVDVLARSYVRYRLNIL